MHLSRLSTPKPLYVLPLLDCFKQKLQVKCTNRSIKQDAHGLDPLTFNRIRILKEIDFWSRQKCTCFYLVPRLYFEPLNLTVVWSNWANKRKHIKWLGCNCYRKLLLLGVEQRKRKRSDSVLWQKPLHQQKCQKGKVTTQTTPQKSSIKQRLRTDLGRSVGLTKATQLVWLTGLRAHLPTNRNSRLIKRTHV